MMSAHWDFVIAAYAITYLTLTAYGLSLVWRLRRQRARSSSASLP
jgi:hypothetical protein